MRSYVLVAASASAAVALFACSSENSLENSSRVQESVQPPPQPFAGPFTCNALISGSAGFSIEFSNGSKGPQGIIKQRGRIKDTVNCAAPRASVPNERRFCTGGKEYDVSMVVFPLASYNYEAEIFPKGANPADRLYVSRLSCPVGPQRGGRLSLTQ